MQQLNKNHFHNVRVEPGNENTIFFTESGSDTSDWGVWGEIQSWILLQMRQLACQEIQHQRPQASLPDQPWHGLKDTESSFYCYISDIVKVYKKARKTHLEIGRGVGAYNRQLKDKGVFRKVVKVGMNRDFRMRWKNQGLTRRARMNELEKLRE